MEPTCRTVLLTISVLTMIGSVSAANIASAQQPGSGRTIRYSQSNALGATYISDQVAIAALEKLGYNVAVTVLAPAAFLQSASQGDMDMSTSINFPQSQVPYQRLEKQLALVGDGSIVGGGVNGYMIDKKTAEAHKLTGIEQLKDPKIAALFDNNRTGKATLINCDPGWSCGDVVEFQLEKFGLTGTVRSVRGKYEALMGETFSRYRTGEPVLFPRAIVEHLYETEAFEPPRGSRAQVSLLVIAINNDRAVALETGRRLLV